MKNRILFRGKRTYGDKGWVEGCLSNLDENAGRVFVVPFSRGEKTTVVARNVDPETVGQFTGLTDKNGKKIFEGDIIKRFWIGREIAYIVAYESTHARFVGKAINVTGFTTFEGDGEMFEVIGNTHDNPELLEVTDNA